MTDTTDLKGFKSVLVSLPSESPDAFQIAPRQPSPGAPNRIIKMGIVALVRWMEKNGYSRETYDYYDLDSLMSTDEELRAYFRRTKPDVVGLSAVVSTSYMQAKRLAAIIREECPDAWIVVGGNLSSSANVVLAKTETDLCIYGDGEVPWVDFLNYVRENGRTWDYEKLQAIKGLVYEAPSGELSYTGNPPTVPDGELVLPDYDLQLIGLQGQDEKLALYIGKGIGDFFASVDPRTSEPNRRPNLAMMPTSKGCVARCTFCQRVFKGYRTAELDKIEEHVVMLKDRFDVGFVYFADENFGSDRDFAYAVAKLMKKHDMLWSGGGTRVSSIKPEDVRFYNDHNCLGFVFGIESGSPRMLDVMEKRFSVETLWKTLDTCIELNMNAPMNLLTGMPGETEETAMESGRLIGDIAYRIGVHPIDLGTAVNYAMPFPGTPLYEYAQQIDMIGKTVDEEEAFLIRIGRGMTNKFNYLNTNGAHLKEAMFWDVLIHMEASRRFRELNKAKPCTPSRLGLSMMERTRRQRKKLLTSSGNILLRLRRAMIVNVGNNEFYDWLPRWIAYPLVKNLLYYDQLLKRVIFKLQGKIYTLGSETKIPPRIPEAYFKDRPSRELSLRWLVHAKREDLDSETEKTLFALRSAI